MQPTLALASTLLLAAPAAAQWSRTTLDASIPFDAYSGTSLADVDSDGDADVVVWTTGTDEVAWYENDDVAGPWARHVVSSTFAAPLFVEPGDVDGDGDVDLVAGGADLGWFPNDGAGGFAAPRPILQPFASHDRLGVLGELADLDGDGDLDLVLTTTASLGNGLQRAVHLYELSQGDYAIERTFGSNTDVGVPAVADLDGDGDDDVLVPFLNWGAIGWYRNDSVPPGPIVLTTVGSTPPSRRPLVLDLDEDGDADLLQVQSNQVGWSENLDGSPDFGPYAVLVPPPAAGNAFVYTSETADVDGDGRVDLVLGVRPDNTTSAGTRTRVAWHRNLGGASLGPIENVHPDPFHEAFRGFAVGDVDGDGDEDVVEPAKLAGGATADLLLHRNEREHGVVVCVGAPNAAGLRGGLRVTGSRAAADDRVVLGAFDLTPNAFGFFLASPTATAPFTPPGSQGTLCLGGPIGRFVGPGEVRDSGPDGAFALRLHLSALPTPTGFVTVAPGDTFVFQAWHREPVSSSNLSAAVEVTFL